MVLFIGLSAYDEQIVKVENPAAITTIEISMAPKDTVLLYKKNDEAYYLVNKETNLVEYRLYSNSQNNTAFVVLMIIVGVVFLFLGLNIGRDS